MCRMIAGAGVVDVEYLVKGLQHMAKAGHVKGWGVAYRSKNGLVVRKSARSCLADKSIEKPFLSDLVVFHARNTSQNASIEFTHPFKAGPLWAFHNTCFSNGAYNPRKLIDHLAQYLDFKSVESSFIKAMSELRDFYGANCILVSPEKMLVCVRYAPDKEDKYQMFFSDDKNSTVVSSERLKDRVWSPLFDRSLLTVKPDGSYERINF